MLGIRFGSFVVGGLSLYNGIMRLTGRRKATIKKFEKEPKWLAEYNRKLGITEIIGGIGLIIDGFIPMVFSGQTEIITKWAILLLFVLPAFIYGVYIFRKYEARADNQ